MLALQANRFFRSVTSPEQNQCLSYPSSPRSLSRSWRLLQRRQRRPEKRSGGQASPFLSCLSSPLSSPVRVPRVEAATLPCGGDDGLGGSAMAPPPLRARLRRTGYSRSFLHRAPRGYPAQHQALLGCPRPTSPPHPSSAGLGCGWLCPFNSYACVHTC